MTETELIIYQRGRGRIWSGFSKVIKAVRTVTVAGYTDNKVVS